MCDCLLTTLWFFGGIPVMNQKKLHGRDAAYSQIRELISSGTLLPGETVSERGLSEKLGIGRTPVREAIKALAHEGLFVIVPMRGTFVRQLSVDDLREIHEMRLALESMAAYLAADHGVTEELRQCAAELVELAKEPRLDTDRAQKLGWQFHDLMFHAAKNQRLLNLYLDLRAQSGLAMQRIEYYGEQRSREALQEHLQVFAAIETGDATRAHAEIWQHLTNAMVAKLNLLTPGQRHV